MPPGPSRVPIVSVLCSEGVRNIAVGFELGVLAIAVLAVHKIRCEQFRDPVGRLGAVVHARCERGPHHHIVQRRKRSARIVRRFNSGSHFSVYYRSSVDVEPEIAKKLICKQTHNGSCAEPGNTSPHGKRGHSQNCMQHRNKKNDI